MSAIRNALGRFVAPSQDDVDEMDPSAVLEAEQELEFESDSETESDDEDFGFGLTSDQKEIVHEALSNASERGRFRDVAADIAAPFIHDRCSFNEWIGFTVAMAAQGFVSDAYYVWSQIVGTVTFDTWRIIQTQEKRQRITFAVRETGRPGLERYDHLLPERLRERHSVSEIDDPASAEQLSASQTIEQALFDTLDIGQYFSALAQQVGATIALSSTRAGDGSLAGRMLQGVPYSFVRKPGRRRGSEVLVEVFDLNEAIENFRANQAEYVATRQAEQSRKIRNLDLSAFGITSA